MYLFISNHFGVVAAAIYGDVDCDDYISHVPIPVKVEPAVMKGALVRCAELAAKDATEHSDGKKEIIVCLDPAGVIGR